MDGIRINKSECLIDRHGNFYGEFYKIQGANPDTGVKSSTKYPKFIEGKLLCLTLTDRDNISSLVLFDQQGNRKDTPYQCPWVHTIFLSECALLKDPKYFGKKCLVVVDTNNRVQLIDFDGNLIEGLSSMKYENFVYPYSKYFIDQVK